MGIQRILICGCARSGNTVMLHLMETGFENVEKNIDGPGNEAFPKKAIEGKVVAGKFPKMIRKLDKVMRDDLGVIYMMRDPRDVLVSKHFLKPNKYWTPPNRWIEAAEIAEDFKDHPNVMLLKYESLVSNPNRVQKHIAQKFGLEIKRPFAECHKYFDQEDQVNLNTMNGARPLDPSRIGNWKDDPAKKQYAQKMLKQHPEIVTYMKRLGYSTED